MKKREDLGIWKALVMIQRCGIIITAIGTTVIVSSACILRWFNINFVGFEEILVMVAFWLYMIGCSYGSYEKSQITADILEVMMKDSLVRDTMILLKWILTTALCIAMSAWALSLLQWSVSVDTRTPIYRIPMVYGHGSMLFGLGLSSFYNICYLYDNIRHLVQKYGKKRLAENGGAEL